MSECQKFCKESEKSIRERAVIKIPHQTSALNLIQYIIPFVTLSHTFVEKWILELIQLTGNHRDIASLGGIANLDILTTQN